MVLVLSATCSSLVTRVTRVWTGTEVTMERVVQIKGVHQHVPYCPLLSPDFQTECCWSSPCRPLLYKVYVEVTTFQSSC